MGDGGVVRPGETGDGVEEDNYVLPRLDKTLGLLQHHLRHLRMPGGWFIESGRNHLSNDALLHVGNFLGALVDEQHDEVPLGVVHRDGIRHLLQQDRLAGLRR